jgi:hypothetical protein
MLIDSYLDRKNEWQKPMKKYLTLSVIRETQMTITMGTSYHPLGWL